MLLEMQTENLDSGTNCTSSDKDKITSINITHDLFIPVNNLTHKVMTKTRKKEGKTGKNEIKKCRSRTFRYGNQTTYKNRDISEKK